MTEFDLAVKEKIKIKKPRNYNVFLYNDDFTSFEFVINVLMTIFGHSAESAVMLTHSIHTAGRGVAGTYTFEIAEQKKLDTIELARANEFPLVVEVEPE